MLDVGTNNEALLEDPLYLGLRQRRLTGEAYDELVEEFIVATQEVFPGVIVQFEDFANHNAFRLLRRYRDRVSCFNDDIQGTAAVAVAGILSALRVTGRTMSEQTFLCLGAGEAATGISDLLVNAMIEDGIDAAAARARCWMVDSKGLVVASRGELAEHKRPYAHAHAPVSDFIGAVQVAAADGHHRRGRRAGHIQRRRGARDVAHQRATRSFSHCRTRPRRPNARRSRPTHGRTAARSLPRAVRSTR